MKLNIEKNKKGKLKFRLEIKKNFLVILFVLGTIFGYSDVENKEEIWSYIEAVIKK